MKRFGLTGAAGYVAPRHMKAIRDTGNVLVAALDPFESVGVIDHYFPDAEFFVSSELFEAYLEQLRDQGNGIDYLSICSPNYLHGPQIRLALRQGADAICEKPLVIDPEELLQLQDLEARTGRRVWTILQLRVHPELLKLKARVAQDSSVKDVVLTYITGRGRWYLKSWKGDPAKSGGLATNIGIHFFDLLSWLFGSVSRLEVHVRTDRVVSGYMELERARVRWFLSIDASYVPAPLRSKGQRTYRSITVDGEEIEFSGGFTDLHTEVYRKTLAGEGFGIAEAHEAIATTAQIRQAELSRASSSEHKHPFLEQ